MAIDYVFHVGMMLFGGVLALFFARILLARPATEPISEKASIPAPVAALSEEVVVR